VAGFNGRGAQKLCDVWQCRRHVCCMQEDDWRVGPGRDKVATGMGGNWHSHGAWPMRGG
jgi:hypothetical protein